MVQKSKERKVRVLDRSNDLDISKDAKGSKLSTDEDFLLIHQNYEDDHPEEEKEWVDVGLDISTSVVGVCLLDSSGSLKKLDAIKLTSTKLKDHYDKADVIRDYDLIDHRTQRIRNIYVEEAHMRFTPGFSSAKTLFSLATFNGIVCQIFYSQYKVKPKKIGVRSARKALKIKVNYKDKTKNTKEKVFDIVRSMNPTFPWAQHVAKTGKKKGQTVYSNHNYDMCDAWVIARGGQIIG